MRRLLLWSIPALLLLALGLAIVLINSEKGAQWAFRIAQGLTPGQLSAVHVGGRLTGPLEISGLHYRHDRIELRLARILIDWRPGRLFSGEVRVHRLELEAVDVAVIPATTDMAARAPSDTLAPFSLELPLAVHLDRFGIDRAVLRLPDKDPIEIERVTLSASARESTLALAQLHIDSSVLTLDAEGQIPLASHGPLRVASRLRVAAAGQDWTGNALLSGVADDLHAELEATEPMGVIANARIQAFASPARWEANLGIDPFRLTDLLPESRAMTVSALELEAEGRGNQIAGSAHLAVHDDELGRWGVDAEGLWDGALWRLDDIRMTAIDGDAIVTGTARQTAGGTDAAYALDLRWEQLAWPPTGEPRVTSRSGAITILGPLADYAFRVDGVLEAFATPPLELEAGGRGSTTGLQLERLLADWLDGRWQSTGTLSWSPTPAWAVELEVDAANPALLYPPLAGRLDGTLHVDGRFDEALTMHADLRRLSAILNDIPITAQGGIGIEDETITVSDLVVNSGDNILRGHARLGSEWDIDWRLDAPDLSSLLPDLSGSLSAEGGLHGPQGSRQARVDLRGTALAWRQAHGVDALALDVDIGLGPDGRWQGTLQAEETRVADQALGRITLDTHGAAADHAMTLRIDSAAHHFEQHLRGTLQAGEWHATLRDGDFATAAVGHWTQTPASRLSYTPAGIALDDYCWRQADSLACLRAGHGADQRSEALLTWQDIDLERLNPFLPHAMRIHGRTQGRAEAVFAAGVISRLQLDSHSDPGALTYRLPPQNDLHALQFSTLRLAASADATAGAHAEALILLNEREQLRAEFRLPAWDPARPVPGPTQSLQGDMALALHDLSLIPLLIPDLQPGPGRIEATLDVTGTIATPQLDGMARIELEHLALIPIGIRLDEPVMQANIRDNRWELTGSTRTDQGRLELTGSGEMNAVDDWHAELAATGQNLQTVRLPTAEIITSPAITVLVKPGELQFGGNVQVPRARIEPIIPESAVPVSADVVIVGEEAPAEAATAFVTHGRMEIVLGDQVRVTGMGFDGRFGGHLMLILGRDGNLSGQGEIRVVEGRYRAYGQNLSISRGRVMYAGGPLENPAIDIIASRMRGDIEVGVRVTGTAENPLVELFSNPAMDDADVLSYLIIGRPMDQATEGDGQMLHQAATSVALVGGEAVAERIAERFDLTEVTIEAGEDVADTALVLGKALSKRLYVRYIQGLVENTNAFQIRYKLNDKWTLETESGTRTGAGADILYTYER